MVNTPLDDPARRIVEAATHLFARKGYSGTGVREIAREAGVNVAMISYYYGGKAGLFEALLKDFFASVAQRLRPAMQEQPESPEDALRLLLPQLIAMMRENRELFRVALTEFPLDLPHIANFKAELVRGLIVPVIHQVLGALAPRMERPVRIEMVGPAVGSILGFHFMLRPVLQEVFETEFDDAFYEEYGQEISHLMLYGLIGRPPVEEAEIAGEEERA